MLKQRIDSILNSDRPEEGGAKESKGDDRLNDIQTSNEFGFVNLQNSSVPSSPFGRGVQPEVCSLRAEEKENATVGTGNDQPESKRDIEADNVLRNQEAAAAFTKKLKEEHRLGLNKLKATLNKNRALKIGELKAQRDEKESRGEETADIDKLIHSTTEGSIFFI